MAGFAILVSIVFIANSPAASSQISTRRLSSAENPRLIGAVFETEKSGRPGILILHGSAGLLPHYREWAIRLSRAGFVTLLVDLYADTGSPSAGSEDRFRCWPVWQAVATRGLVWLRSHPKVDSVRIGVIGFSRGAWIALTTPLRDIRAFVNLYGVGGQSLEKGWDPMPPTLMFYGGRDQWASADFIAGLESTLKGRSRSVSTVVYPEAGHGFTLRQDPMPGADSEAAEDAWRRILAFLKQTLGGSSLPYLRLDCPIPFVGSHGRKSVELQWFSVQNAGRGPARSEPGRLTRSPMLPRLESGAKNRSPAFQYSRTEDGS